MWYKLLVRGENLLGEVGLCYALLTIRQVCCSVAGQQQSAVADGLMKKLTKACRSGGTAE